MKFSLMFFASSEEALGENKYRLLVESARFGDRHGFASVWVPERHFTTFGCIYPNPAVLHAALARETQSIRLHAGSVVLPLHDPIRVAEEWAVVDNLSAGRVGVAFASGWNPDDFAFFPDRYERRREAMFAAIETVQRLWRGETIAATSGSGRPSRVRIYPAPIQKALPIWITAAGNADTFVKAGEMGAHLLTHLLDQGVEELARKISLYREARRRRGHSPEAGQVTVMVHTFVGLDLEEVREAARSPYCQYLKAHASLLEELARSRGREVDVASLSAKDLDDFVNFLYDRFAASRGLIGTPRSCLPLLDQLDRADVDEVACLLDFGPPTDRILQGLPQLDELKDLFRKHAEARRPATTPSGVEEEFEPPLDRSSPVSVAEIQARCETEVPGAEFYRRLAEREVELRGSFRGVHRLWRRDGEALGWVRLADAECPSNPYRIHPGLLDACNQVFAAALPAEASSRDGGALYLPVGLDEFRLHGDVGDEVWSHATLRRQPDPGTRTFEGDVRILDEGGTLQAEIAGLRVRATPRALFRSPHREAMRDWIYEPRWEPSAGAEAVEPRGRRGTWLIFADTGGVGGRFGALLAARGDTAVLVSPAAAFRALDAHRFEIDHERPQDIERLVELLRRPEYPELVGVAHLWSADATSADQTTVDSLQADQALGGASVFHLLQALVKAGESPLPQLWLVTRGAQPVGEEAAEIAQAPLWALGRVLRAEHPEMWGGLVDLDPQGSPTLGASQLLAAVNSADGEDQVAFRQEKRFVARLVRVPWSPAGERDFAVEGSHSYLITGGLGDLGLRVAAWLVEKGARHLILLGRSELPPRSQWGDVEPNGIWGRRIAELRHLQSLGAAVHVRSVDISDPAQVSSFIDFARASGWPPIRGVVHAAAAFSGALLTKMDTHSWNAVMRPKVLGAWLLHRLFENEPLDFFVLFSAVPALVGPAGLGAANYAAANAFLDALAHYRRRAGLPALSVNWGPWAEIGLAARRAGGLAALARQGLVGMAPHHAIEALAHVLRRDTAQVVVTAFDWPRFFRSFPRAAGDPDLSRMATESSAQVTPRPSGKGNTTPSLAALRGRTSDENQGILLGYLTHAVGQALGLHPSEVDAQAPLASMGLDSLMAIDLKNRMATDHGLEVSIVALIDGISVTQLAGRLAEHLASPRAAKPVLPPAAEPIGRVAEGIDPEKARELLVDLDKLSDAQVAQLLRMTSSEA